MKRHRRKFCIFTFAPFILASASFGQTVSGPGRMIHEPINGAKRVALVGNTRPEATAENDNGIVSDSYPMSHMLLQLKRSPERETALEGFIDELHDPSSANFHKWLTATEFAAQFGAAPEDVETISKWLTDQGFTIDGVAPTGLLIEFSGTAGQVRKAFQTEIHHVSVDGKKHVANMSDPEIPAALEQAVAGVISLHNFMPKGQLLKKPEYTYATSNGTFHALVPGDIATIYNMNPLFAAGYSGQGQSIMVVEDTYLYSADDWTVFRKTFGLARPYPHGSLSQVSPKGELTCGNPGFQGSTDDPGYGDDGEAIIDVEWATAAAPNAAIVLSACEDTETVFGGLIALINTLNGPAAKLPSVVSISYGESEEYNGAAANLAYALTYEQGVAEGVSIFVSSGDDDAASSDAGNKVAKHGITVSGFTSTPYNVSVGGLDFGYTAFGVDPATYWKDTNSNTYSSALSYIQEVPWNNSCAGSLVASFFGISPADLCNNPAITDPSSPLHFLLNASGGSGGPSGCAIGTPKSPGRANGTCAGWAKPSWQKGLVGVPHDGVRDIPDVSLFASNGFWDAYYVVCWSNPDTTVGGGGSCLGAPSTWPGFGGTSVSSPMMAGIQALVNQKTGSRWGNPNTVYYALAKHEYGEFGAAACDSALGAAVSAKCLFYDVTQGDNDAACKKKDCFIEGTNTYGILSTSKKKEKPAYLSNIGWDFSTGIGSVNAYNLVMKWPAMAAPDSSAVLTSAGGKQ